MAAVDRQRKPFKHRATIAAKAESDAVQIEDGGGYGVHASTLRLIHWKAASLSA